MAADAYRTSRRQLDDLVLLASGRGARVEPHLVKGEAGVVVPDVLDTLRPGVLVMGTLARTGLKGVFVGNTAERVLDRTQGYAAWHETVTKMSRKMPKLLEEGELRSIVAYLTALRGSPQTSE